MNALRYNPVPATTKVALIIKKEKNLLPAWVAKFHDRKLSYVV
jgi:hypothetical protein